MIWEVREGLVGSSARSECRPGDVGRRLDEKRVARIVGGVGFVRNKVVKVVEGKTDTPTHTHRQTPTNAPSLAS